MKFLVTIPSVLFFMYFLFLSGLNFIPTEGLMFVILHTRVGLLEFEAVHDKNVLLLASVSTCLLFGD